jgi:hypothetical protein
MGFARLIEQKVERGVEVLARSRASLGKPGAVLAKTKERIQWPARSWKGGGAPR